GRQLVDRRQLEVRLLLGDEVGPELGDLLVRHAAGHVDQILLEAVFLEHALEAAVAHEDGIVPVLAQLLSDADAVQRRAEGGLRKKYDRLAHLFSSAQSFSITAWSACQFSHTCCPRASFADKGCPAA